MPVVTETRAYGCPLPKPAVSSRLPKSTPPVICPDEEITYSRDVAPILWKNCVICHRPGQVGPFSLLNYRDAAKRAEFLREITASRRMPPWKPHPGSGSFSITSA